MFLLLLLPDDVEDGRDQQLVVDGRGHVARLVESRGHGADGVAQVHPPQQEEELRWGTQEVRQVNGCLLWMVLGCWRNPGAAQPPESSNILQQLVMTGDAFRCQRDAFVLPKDVFSNSSKGVSNIRLSREPDVYSVLAPVAS